MTTHYGIRLTGQEHAAIQTGRTSFGNVINKIATTPGDGRFEQMMYAAREFGLIRAELTPAAEQALDLPPLA